MKLQRWQTDHTIHKRFRVPTDWLEGKYECKEVPQSRPLDPVHVDALFMSFHKQQCRNPSILMVIWGAPPRTVAGVKSIGEDVPKKFLGVPELEALLSESRGMAPISGRHSTHANAKLHQQFPRHILWKELDFGVMVVPGNRRDEEMAHCKGQQANYIAGAFKKPTFADMVIALHTSLTHKIKELGVYPGEKDCQVIKSMWSLFNCVNTTYIGQFWSIAKHTGPVWEKLESVIKGQVARRRGGPAFKVPKSTHLFNQMGNLPDDVLLEYLDHVISGMWTMKAFYDECKRHKATLLTRRLILEFLIIKDWLPDGSSWDDCRDKYKDVDDVWVDMWVNSVMKMPISKASLPDNARNALIRIHTKAVMENRTGVHFFLLLPDRSLTNLCTDCHHAGQSCPHQDGPVPNCRLLQRRCHEPHAVPGRHQAW